MSTAVTLTREEVETIQLLLVLSVSKFAEANDKNPHPKLTKAIENMIALSYKIEPHNGLWDKPLDKYVDMRYQFPGCPRQ